MDKNMQEIEKKALRAIKISIASIAISIFLGILSLWVLLNQVTISVGIDKKLIQIEKQIQDMQKPKSIESSKLESN
ncbi:DUF5408 family protein [Helicobacter sp. MIT 99-5507]|uniref:DUF5408 family protein n=1 Tax=Helicobacter sp. MIT 99-5507 TaxID=152489 RepID=UPI000E1F8759|nr:DUF5408 family protein [Helicobacter sp. MIT 99-5507]RDU57798.1 hypothetical protein CQA42_02530 [Helicobacter sp. MIT 99-5507]